MSVGDVLSQKGSLLHKIMAIRRGLVKNIQMCARNRFANEWERVQSQEEKIAASTLCSEALHAGTTITLKKEEST